MSKLYTTDGKVRWFANEEDVNSKLISILGEKFETYRKKWEQVNKFELETEFPLFLQVETNQICNLKCHNKPPMFRYSTVRCGVLLVSCIFKILSSPFILILVDLITTL